MYAAKTCLLLILLVSGPLFAEDAVQACSVASGIACKKASFAGVSYLVCTDHQADVSRTYYAVDAKIYRGWQTYETFCASCHYKHAQGPIKSKLPEHKVGCRPHNLLVDSVLGEFAYFKTRVENGVPRDYGDCHTEASKKIWNLRMPAWKNVALVKRNYTEIYGYLKLMQNAHLPNIRKERLHRLSNTDLTSLSCKAEE